MAIVPVDAFHPPAAVSYAWDEGDHLDLFYFLPAALHDRLLLLTPNANFALCIGAAEWILARLAAFDADPEARHFVAAAWADMCPGWHCARFVAEKQEWQGPVRGVLATVVAILYDAMDGRGDNPELADRACWMHNLAQHVLDPLAPYDAWFDQSVERLMQHHRRDLDPLMWVNLFADTFPVGAAVSPEALMPQVPYDPTIAGELVGRLVQRQRRDGNPFVLDDQEFG